MYSVEGFVRKRELGLHLGRVVKLEITVVGKKEDTRLSASVLKLKGSSKAL